MPYIANALNAAILRCFGVYMFACLCSAIFYILFVTIRLTTAVTYVATFKFQLLSFVYQVRKFEKENRCQDVTSQYCKKYHYHNTKHISRACTTFRRSFFMPPRFTSAKLELHAFLRTRTIPHRQKKKKEDRKKRAIDREKGGVINYEV